MKKTLHFIGILILVFSTVFISCDDKAKYSLGDFRIELATVQPEGENAYTLILDNGERLWPAAADVRYSPNYNQRVFLNYTILSDAKNGYDHYIKVNDIWNILTKQAIELNEQNKDSIGNDVVKINDMWIGGDYLNVSFMFNYGGVKPHAINLVHNMLKETPSEQNTIELEFRHNAYESSNTKLYEGFVCFDLKPFRIEGEDSVPFSIKVKEAEGEKTVDVVYRYNQMDLTQAGVERPIPVITSNEYY